MPRLLIPDDPGHKAVVSTPSIKEMAAVLDMLAKMRSGFVRASAIHQHIQWARFTETVESITFLKSQIGTDLLGREFGIHCELQKVSVWKPNGNHGNWEAS